MSLGREAQIRWGAELKGPGLGAWSRRRNDNRQSLPAPQQHQILLSQQPWKEMVMAGKPWKLYIIFGSFQAFAQIISVVWTSKGKTKVLQTWTEPKHTWNKDKHCRCSYSLSPSLTPSCISDISMQWRFQSSLVHQSGRWQNAGQLRLVQIVSHCKGLRSKSWFIYSFLCSRSQILNSCQNAVPILWDMFAVEQVKKIIWCPQGNPLLAGLYWWLPSQRIHLKDYDPLSEAVQCYALQINWWKKRLHLSPKEKTLTYRQIILLVI